MSGTIPIIGYHRGVGLHDMQDKPRLEVVRRDIDDALALNDVRDLFELSKDCSRAPEARLAAAERIKAIWALYEEQRRARPAAGLTIEDVEAAVAGLDRAAWRDPWHYGVLADPCLGSRPVKRETPLPYDHPSPADGA